MSQGIFTIFSFVLPYFVFNMIHGGQHFLGRSDSQGVDLGPNIVAYKRLEAQGVLALEIWISGRTLEILEAENFWLWSVSPQIREKG